jgi:glutaredoxin 3
MSKLPPIDLDWPAPPSTAAVPSQPDVPAPPRVQIELAPQPQTRLSSPASQSAAPLYPGSRPRCTKHALFLDNKSECARCHAPKLSATWVYLLVIGTLAAIGILFVTTRVLGYVREFAQAQEELQRGAGTRDVRAQSARVVMYTTSTCPACRSAKSWLAANKIAYDERGLDTDEQAIREYSKLGARVVPTFVIDGQVFAGFSATQIQAALAKPAL